MSLSPIQDDALAIFMAWGEQHLDDEGRRQYPEHNLFTSMTGQYILIPLIKKGYVSDKLGNLLPTPKAEKWWAHRKSSRRRLVLKVDNQEKG